MRVGVVANEPWARLDERPSGVEVELIEEFAGEPDAEPVYGLGTPPELLEATRQGEVDVMIGGFTDSTTLSGGRPAKILQIGDAPVTRGRHHSSGEDHRRP